ncbi:MAG: hypothetical protein F6J92_12500 [Symploca sp. SIO1A3]|nr:hypothetical protein [Symploca sp. SIO1A3]
MKHSSWMLAVGKRLILSFFACLIISTVFLGIKPAVAEDIDSHLYFSNGVHNNVGCEDSCCVPPRKQTDPSDPQYPKWWVSDWTMYRVFNNYKQFPPPYDSPPQGLIANEDYEVSYGTTYYDSTYIPEDKDGKSAMMEYYEKRCLPIFPQDNKYTCSFVSLGNKAYFLSDGNHGNPPICLFSPENHPPRTDFIKHLPYNPEDSAHLNNSLQAYSLLVSPQAILFGYAFNKQPTPDSFDSTAKPYRHPQSFYFSGYPEEPPNAPIVSQNYTNFRMEQPNANIWREVAEMLPPNPELCCLFADDCIEKNSTENSPAASWDALRYSAP